ncbi:hypothetical protein ACIBCA_05690 [Kitasatospora sp. NPDC051170]|uniref:hypothetical protein n=1 Tax=Kitasatospora sp. NPDC051170 TaxID=3364056 RepID=UPI0037AFD65E
MAFRSDVQRDNTAHQRDAVTTLAPVGDQGISSVAALPDRATERRERLAFASANAREVLSRHQFADGLCSNGCGAWPCNTVVDAVQACDGDR